MTDPVEPVSLRVAEARSVRARAKLNATVAELRARFEPRALVETAKREAAAKTTAAANAGVKAAMLNPGATAGAVAGVGLFLVRHRLFRLFRRTPKPTAQPAAKPALVRPRAPAPARSSPDLPPPLT